MYGEEEAHKLGDKRTTKILSEDDRRGDKEATKVTRCSGDRKQEAKLKRKTLDNISNDGNRSSGCSVHDNSTGRNS